MLCPERDYSRPRRPALQNMSRRGNKNTLQLRVSDGGKKANFLHPTDPEHADWGNYDLVVAPACPLQEEVGSRSNDLLQPKIRATPRVGNVAAGLMTITLIGPTTNPFSPAWCQARGLQSA